ncbi:MAG TPA: GNAT family N-acetyltransferase, partial [Noviherbaspirillum sp.]|nr:GNAT family N-acetyltransferase [Noviherbaspirillum sp.]
LWSELQVRRFLFDDQPVSMDVARATLNICLSRRETGTGLWVLRLADNGAPVGCAGLNPAAASTSHEPRLAGLLEPLAALHPEHWHRGYAIEALDALLRHAFETLGQERVGAANDLPNLASARMLERLGFVPIGKVQGPRYRMRTYILTREAWRRRMRRGASPDEG